MSKYILGLLCVIMTLLSAPLPVFAQEAQLTEYDMVRIPIGYIEFCARSPGDRECRPLEGETPERVTLTREGWKAIKQVNTFLNTTIQPMSDEALYGKPEFWTRAKDAGDCEDVALELKDKLVQMGIYASALRIAVVLDEKKQGHAVLMLLTDKGDYVLDYRRKNDILLWHETGYEFLRRQTVDPRQWAELGKPPMVLVSKN